MQLNTHIIVRHQGLHINSYGIELDYRLSELRALYEANTVPVAGGHRDFRQTAFEFVASGGQVHFCTTLDERILGSAYVLPPNSLFQSLYSVERFFVEGQGIDPETQFAVADALLQNIIEVAEKEATESLGVGSVWIQLTFPEGALTHPESQPIYGALEHNGFRGVQVARAELWVKFIEALVKI